VILGITGRRSSQASDTLQVVRVRQRLEGLEGIISGLQGGVLKLVDAIHRYTDNTETLINEKVKSVIDKLTAQSGKGDGVQGKCTHDNTAIVRLLENYHHKMTENIQSIDTRISSIEHIVSTSDMVDKMNSVSEKLTKINKQGSDPQEIWKSTTERQ
jgi:hypothetical protein